MMMMMMMMMIWWRIAYRICENQVGPVSGVSSNV
jgi:hypothetical protein